MPRIILELSEELALELERIAEVLGIASAEEAGRIGVADWIARRRAEIDDRDPGERYFVNEALDQLAARTKG